MWYVTSIQKVLADYDDWLKLIRLNVLTLVGFKKQI